MSEFTMTINGIAAQTHASFDVINPAKAKSFATVPDASDAQVEQAVQSAKTAYKTWSSDENMRREALGKLPHLIRTHQAKLAQLLTCEQGKSLACANDEINCAVREIELTLEQQLPYEVLPADHHQTNYVLTKPMGVVAGICPWNFPIHTAMLKIIPALLVGNTIVVKPAPTTPVTTLYLGELLRQVLPPGVCNVITGKDKTTVGEALVKHQDIAKISFTGSVATGKKIAAIAAQSLKRVTLELGGNDPAIVLADVNVKEKAKAIFWGAFANCGQICVAIKRLYVHESVFEPMVQALSELANTVKVGDGLDDDTQIGPLNNLSQLERIETLLNDAKLQGAKIEAGGARLNRPGYFYQPTIVTGIKEGVRLVDEEQFGPVLPILSFKTESEAIERANNTKMGLGASVWSGDVKKAELIAKQLEAGSVWVNHIHGGSPSAPFGGFKESGIGRECGQWGLDGMAEVQSISVQKD